MRRSSGRFASASAVKVNNVRFGSLPTPKRAKHVAPLGANGGQIVQQAAAAVAAGQFTAYKLRFQVVAMGAVYAWLVVAAVADPAGCGQRDGCRR